MWLMLNDEVCRDVGKDPINGILESSILTYLAFHGILLPCNVRVRKD